MDPDELSNWLDCNRELIDDHLAYALSQSQHDIATTVCLAKPNARLTYPDLAQPAEPTPRIDLALYFVGPDRATAITTKPFLDHTEATTSADALGHTVFTTAADISAAALRDT